MSFFTYTKLHPEAAPPVRAYGASAAWDLAAFMRTPEGRYKTATLAPRTTMIVPTGLALRAPLGSVILICSRSGLAARSVFVTNAPGVVDPDYIGEIKVLLSNGGMEPYYVQHGDRIAQALLVHTTEATLRESSDLQLTERGDKVSAPAAFKLPNVRRLFIPDKGYMLYEADLSGADGQVVAWEAEDKELKQWLKDGTDMHVKHAIEVGRDIEIARLDPKSYRFYQIRQSYKHATHGVHYGASDFALTRHASIGWPRHKALAYIANYFARRPGVKEWHLRTAHNLQTERTARNAFGYRIIYFDRVDGLLPQALAWVPQSTVALVCFKGALRLRKALPWVEILVQVHDSLLFQVPMHRADSIPLFHQHLAVEVPYPNDPLVIPWGMARSERSWEKYKNANQ